ncbi:MAG: ABC transporter permease [Euryarchaeota archaeon]|nr:ABC transporter permease [Euryarchaeota archaeon]
MSIPLRPWLRAVAGFAYRDLQVVRRNFFAFFEMFFWPLFGLASVGFLSTYLQAGTPEAATILTGAIALSVLQVSQIDTAYILLFDAWGKSLKHTFLAPVPDGTFVAGAWLVGTLRGLVVFTVLHTISLTAFGFNVLQAGPLPVALFLFGIFLTAALVGMLVCALLLTFGLKAEAAAWSISMLLLFFSGFYYPATILPPPLYQFSRLLPTSHLLEYLRGQFTGGAGLEQVAIAYALTGIYLVLGLLGLRWTIRRAKRTGLLLRLSE